MSATTIQSSKPQGSGWETTQLILNIATALAMAGLMWVSLVYAKPAANLAGDEQFAQRIFYIHMGCNIGALVAFLMSVIGSVVYLFTRDLDWDRVAHASVEVGIVIGLGTITTGAIWAKPTWNTYWTWDPRFDRVNHYCADLCCLYSLPQRY